MKLQTIIARGSDLAARFVAQVADYAKHFSSNQGAYLGKVQVYTLLDSNFLADGKSETTQVTTTVQEKWDYFINEVNDYVVTLLAKEETNGSGLARAPLVVEGQYWGEFSSNALMALKGLVDNNPLKNMIAIAPIRTPEIWTPTQDPNYTGRLIFQKVAPASPSVTTVKEQYILVDPNIQIGQPSTRQPQVATKDTRVEFGKTETTHYSGQISNQERAAILKRLSVVKDAITVALHQANEVEAVESPLTGFKLFGYIFNGTNTSITE